jgi:amidase
LGGLTKPLSRTSRILSCSTKSTKNSAFLLVRPPEQDCIKFSGHSDIVLAYTGQEDLKKALANTATEEHITALKMALRKKAKNIIDEALDSAGVTLIAALADSPLCIHAAAAGMMVPKSMKSVPFLTVSLLGYPIATIPLGQLRYNGRPFGLCVIARGDEEETLLRFMDMYETTVASPRPIPSFRGL